MQLKVSEREFDTILAALRAWEGLMNGQDVAKMFGDLIEIAENDRKGDDAALSIDEIDNLCEDLNCGGVSCNEFKRIA